MQYPCGKRKTNGYKGVEPAPLRPPTRPYPRRGAGSKAFVSKRVRGLMWITGAQTALGRPEVCDGGKDRLGSFEEAYRTPKALSLRREMTLSDRSFVDYRILPTSPCSSALTVRMCCSSGSLPGVHVLPPVWHGCMDVIAVGNLPSGPPPKGDPLGHLFGWNDRIKCEAMIVGGVPRSSDWVWVLAALTCVVEAALMFDRTKSRRDCRVEPDMPPVPHCEVSVATDGRV